MRKHRTPRLGEAVSDPHTFARVLSSLFSVCSSEPGAEAQGERARENKKPRKIRGFYVVAISVQRKSINGIQLALPRKHREVSVGKGNY
jgi:hypothetical protein